MPDLLLLQLPQQCSCCKTRCSPQTFSSLRTLQPKICAYNGNKDTLWKMRPLFVALWLSPIRRLNEIHQIRLWRNFISILKLVPLLQLYPGQHLDFPCSPGRCSRRDKVLWSITQRCIFELRRFCNPTLICVTFDKVARSRPLSAQADDCWGSSWFLQSFAIQPLPKYLIM